MAHWGHTTVKVTVPLEVRVFVFFADEGVESFGAGLVVSLLDAEVSQFAEGAVLATQEDRSLARGNIDLVAGHI